MTALVPQDSQGHSLLVQCRVACICTTTICWISNDVHVLRLMNEMTVSQLSTTELRMIYRAMGLLSKHSVQELNEFPWYDLPNFGPGRVSVSELARHSCHECCFAGSL
jgi:hypothetical protein